MVSLKDLKTHLKIAFGVFQRCLQFKNVNGKHFSGFKYTVYALALYVMGRSVDP